MPQRDSILFYEIKLEISEVFQIAISVYILKSKTRKTLKFFEGFVIVLWEEVDNF